jgi:hypothetical protein
MGWMTRKLKYGSQQGCRYFSSPLHADQLCGPHSLLSYPAGTGTLSLRIKLLECEADHSSPSNAGIKNIRSNASPPSHIIIALCLITSRYDLKFPVSLHINYLIMLRKLRKSGP